MAAGANEELVYSESCDHDNYCPFLENILCPHSNLLRNEHRLALLHLSAKWSCLVCIAMKLFLWARIDCLT